jgi:hypothetical protein
MVTAVTTTVTVGKKTLLTTRLKSSIMITNFMDLKNIFKMEKVLAQV